MPKIIYAIPQFDTTGEMRAPYQVLKGFAKTGWETEILTIASPSNADIDMAWNLVPVRQVSARTRRHGYARLARKLLERTSQTLVFSWVWDWHNFALSFDRILRHTPFVLTMDGYAHRHPWHGTDWFTQARMELRYGINIRHADLIIAENPTAYQQIANLYPDLEARRVPVCLWQEDLVGVESLWAKAGHQLKRRPLILYTGRIERRKGVHDLIAAFGDIAWQFPEWEVEIRGSITDDLYFNELTGLVASYDLETRIRFEPMLTGEALYRRYRSSSVFCLPSTGEGFPTTIIEAMYFGGAIVAGSSGSVPYQLDSGRAGLLFEYGDVDALKGHLRSLMIDNEIRAYMMQNSRKRVVDEFTWERYFPSLERLCREITNDSN